MVLVSETACLPPSLPIYFILNLCFLMIHFAGIVLDFSLLLKKNNTIYLEITVSCSEKLCGASIWISQATKAYPPFSKWLKKINAHILRKGLISTVYVYFKTVGFTIKNNISRIKINTDFFRKLLKCDKWSFYKMLYWTFLSLGRKSEGSCFVLKSMVYSIAVWCLFSSLEFREITVFSTWVSYVCVLCLHLY